MANSIIKVPCRISRGPFSGERIVEMNLDSFDFKAAVPVHYCELTNGQPLSEEQPSRFSPIDGVVRVVVTSCIADRCSIAMPDGTIQEVTTQFIRKLSSKERAA